MTFGAHSFGSRSFGDSAPTGAGIASTSGSVSGAIISTLPAVEQGAVGTHDADVAGTIISTLPAITQVATGPGYIHPITGTAVSTLPSIGQFAWWTRTRIEVRHFPFNAGLTGSYTTLSGARAKKFLAELSRPGAFSAELSLADPKWAAVEEGDYIQYVVDGAPMFTGVYNRDEATIKHRQNHVEQNVVLGGNGLAIEWEDAIVRAPTPVGSDLESDVRYFDWSSPELDDSGWDAATVLFKQKAAPTIAKKGKPLGSPNPETEWVWSAPHAGDYLYGPGVSPFRGTFTLAAAATVALHIACDDGFVARLDGVDLGGTNQLNGWQKVWRADVDLAAGTHTLAVLGENFDREASTNSAGLIVDIYTLDSAGRYDQHVSGTSVGTKTVHYPKTLPGFTVGNVLRILLKEAQADGALLGWVLNCTATHDADGVAWPINQAFAFDRGADLLSVLEELTGVHIDYTVDTDSKTLNVYNIDGAGSPVSVATITSSLLHLSASRRGQIKNSLDVRYAGGSFEVTNAASVAAIGNRWGYLSLGAVEDEDAARVMAQKEVDRLASPRDEIKPDLDGKILHDAMLDPFSVWGLGDYITLLDRSSAAADFRTLGIGITEDKNQLLTVSPTLNSRIEVETARVTRAITRMQRGTLDGRSLIASTPRPSSSVRIRKAEIETVVADAPGPWGGGRYLNARSAPYRNMRPGILVWIEYEWDTAPTTDVIIAYEIDGVVASSHTLLGGQSAHDEYPAYEVSRAKIITKVTNDDADASGLGMKLHFLHYE